MNRAQTRTQTNLGRKVRCCCVQDTSVKSQYISFKVKTITYQCRQDKIFLYHGNTKVGRNPALEIEDQVLVVTLSSRAYAQAFHVTGRTAIRNPLSPRFAAHRAATAQRNRDLDDVQHIEVDIPGHVRGMEVAEERREVFNEIVYVHPPGLVELEATEFEMRNGDAAKILGLFEHEPGMMGSGEGVFDLVSANVDLDVAKVLLCTANLAEEELEYVGGAEFEYMVLVRDGEGVGVGLLADMDYGGVAHCWHPRFGVIIPVLTSALRVAVAVVASSCDASRALGRLVPLEPDRLWLDHDEGVGALAQLGGKVLKRRHGDRRSEDENALIAA